MSAQQRAFDPGPATGGMSDNEQFVLTLLQQHPQGLRTIDVGRALHITGSYQCRTCNDERTCEWASPNAGRILDSLGTSGRQLVIRRKTGLWQALYGVQDGRYDPATAPLPQGF